MLPTHFLLQSDHQKVMSAYLGACISKVLIDEFRLDFIIEDGRVVCSAAWNDHSLVST